MSLETVTVGQVQGMLDKAKKDVLATLSKLVADAIDDLREEMLGAPALDTPGNADDAERETPDADDLDELLVLPNEPMGN